MMKFFILFSCLLAIAYGGGLTGLAGQNILGAPIAIQTPIIKSIQAPLVIPQIPLAHQPSLIRAQPIAIGLSRGPGLGVGVGHLGLGGGLWL